MPHDRRPLVLYAADPAEWDAWRPALRQALDDAGVNAELTDHAPDPTVVDYIVYAPAAGHLDFTPFRRLKAVLSLWAGVETVQDNPTLTVPLARMVDPGLTAGMVEWVTGHVLRHHLGLDRHILGQDGIWRGDEFPPLAAERPVGILGLGELGGAVARALAGLGFPVRGWSRSPKALPGISCHHGEAGLAAVLESAQILVLLLPLTPATGNILDARRLALLPEGAVVINPGRGALIDDTALLEALDSGQVGHATLDVFRKEPLPPDHPFWAHPKVTVTPHVASATRPATAARSVAENIRRAEAGQPLLHLVDRAQGY